MNSNPYVLKEIKRNRPFSVSFEGCSNANHLMTTARAKSCLKRIDNSPFGKFQRCVLQKEAQINLVKQKRVKFSA